jgi:glutaredoxin-dependent peroxiredoxin
MSLLGQTAPDFTLPNHKREPVSLSGLRGKKVVLAFYPAAFTGVCQKELCSFRDSLADFEGLNAVVLGLSVDSPFANAAFANQNGLTYSLLSDVHRTATTAYDVAWPNFAGMAGFTVSNRAVFVVDEEGKVSYEWKAPNPGVEPDYAAVKAAIGG